jgi:Na+-transporting NADH:ubiquinone oxidoreductase subunit NqrC
LESNIQKQLQTIWILLGVTFLSIIIALVLVRKSLNSQNLLYSREAYILNAKGLTPAQIKEKTVEEEYRLRNSELLYLGKGLFEFHAPPTIRLILIKNALHENQGKMDSVEVLPHYVRYRFRLKNAPPITVVTNGGTFIFKKLP